MLQRTSQNRVSCRLVKLTKHAIIDMMSSRSDALTLTSDLSTPPSASLHSTVNASDDQNHYNIDPDSTFSVRCSFQSPNDFDLFAFKDGSQLTGSSVSTSTTTSSSPTRTTKELTIQLTSFSAGDNGVYQCNASNSERSLLSRSVLLSTGLCCVRMC